MKKPLDNFSRQANAYKKFRPVYPDGLYQIILSEVDEKNSCWDCGTGNGQVAAVLSGHFDEIWATDISQEQLNQAPDKSNVHYKKERAEQTNFDDDYFNLVTVAQAVHWFDFEAFNNEVKRVLKPNGVIAMWGYGLLKISEPIDELTHHFCNVLLKDYWDMERRYVDEAYRSVTFNFDEIVLKNVPNIVVRWTPEQLQGYLNSWSSVQKYKQVNGQQDPVWPLMESLSEVWTEGEMRNITFPIFLRLGRVRD